MGYTLEKILLNLWFIDFYDFMKNIDGCLTALYEKKVRKEALIFGCITEV